MSIATALLAAGAGCSNEPSKQAPSAPPAMGQAGSLTPGAPPGGLSRAPGSRPGGLMPGGMAPGGMAPGGIAPGGMAPGGPR